MTKREFNSHWRSFFLEMTDEELYTVIVWVTQMQEADMWQHFVNHAVRQLDVARMKATEEEQTIEDEPEVLH